MFTVFTYMYIVLTLVMSLLYGFFSPWIFQGLGEIRWYRQRVWGRVEIALPFYFDENHTLSWWWWQVFINFFQTIVGSFLFWKALEMSLNGIYGVDFYLLFVLGFFGWIGRLEKLFFIFYTSFPNLLLEIVTLIKKISGKIGT